MNLNVTAALLSAVALFLYCAYTAFHAWRKRTLRVSSFAWPLAFVLILAGMCTIFAKKYYFDNDLLPVVASVIAIVTLGITGIYAGELIEKISGRIYRSKHYMLIKAVGTPLMFLTLTGLAFICVEYAFNAHVWQMYAEAYYEFFFLLLCFVMLYFTGNLWKPLTCLLLVALTIFGLANEVIYLVRGTVLTPGDMMVLNTAMEVSSRVSLRFEARSLAVLVALAASFALLIVWPRMEKDAAYRWLYAKLSHKISGRLSEERFVKVLYYLKNVVAGLCALALSMSLYSDIIHKSGAKFATWLPVDSYQDVGVLAAHIIQYDRLNIEQPQGYSDERAEELLASYSAAFDTSSAAINYAAASAQFTSQKPTVIGIMNESYANLATLKLVEEAGYGGPVGTSTIFDAILHGQYFVKVLGGGTANSEFEFLTGASMNYIGEGKYPYTLYDLSGVDSLVKQFKTEGYETIAIHPEDPTNYSRQVTYKALGFDEFISKGDFDKTPLATKFHAGYSDEATYNKILDLLAKNDDPQFIFDVTMQNHQGYDMNNIPSSLLTHYSLPIFDDYDNGQLNEYLTCINESDAALLRFVEALRKLDRPVILVFFGDHMPTVASWIADNTEGLTGIDKTLAQHQTVYVMWANYKLAGSEQQNSDEAMSSSNLGAYLAARAGLPLTDFQKATLYAAKTIPNSSRGLIQDRDGTWYKASDADLPEDARAVYDDMDIIQYMTFAKKVQ